MSKGSNRRPPAIDAETERANWERTFGGGVEKKYLVIPGYVRSQHDGDRHFIDAQQLMRLYRVNPAECVVSTDGRHHRFSRLIRLEPRYDGRYDLL